ncbi:hypothetical protein SESBI_05156 [Sesbania bispinosa]|nr:hypothetical protein SESBI_05156 [Sesbania bispinosa]
MSIGLEGETENGISMYPEKITTGRQTDCEFQHRTESMKSMTEKGSRDYRCPSYFASTRLDLRTEENGAAASCKQLDLNGFSRSLEAKTPSSSREWTKQVLKATLQCLCNDLEIPFQSAMQCLGMMWGSITVFKSSLEIS